MVQLHVKVNVMQQRCYGHGANPYNSHNDQRKVFHLTTVKQNHELDGHCETVRADTLTLHVPRSHNTPAQHKPGSRAPALSSSVDYNVQFVFFYNIRKSLR